MITIVRHLLIIAWVFFMAVPLMNCSHEEESRPDPASVLIQYRDLRDQSKLSEAYQLLADTCKTYISEEEFISYNTPAAGLQDSHDISIMSIDTLPVFDDRNYARFKIDYRNVNLDSQDTTYGQWDYSLLFEEGEWKVIWFGKMINMASEHMQNRRYEQSLVLYMVITGINPYNDIALRGLALSYANLSEHDKAIAAAERIVALRPDDSYSYALLGDFYGSAKRFDEAISSYQKAISLYQEPLYYVNMGSIYKLNEQFVEADDAYRKSLALDSLSPEAWWMLGELYMNNLDDLKKAKSCFQRAIRLPDMSEYYQQQLFYDYALLLFREASADDQHADPENMANLGEAKEYIGKALQIDPHNSDYAYLSNEINKRLMGE